jgi:polyisoprenoid-binding protein YceI
LTVTFKTFLLTLLSVFTLPATALEYAIDPAHTYASFAVDHLGFSTQRGQFRQSIGTIEFDSEAQRGSVDITIDASSLDTGLVARDDILRGEHWFNVAAFPAIIYRSDRLVFDQDKLIAIDGRLILLGEIRPLRLEITRFKCGLNLANRKRGCGADAQGVLLRSDFGMLNSIPFIGDQVHLLIQVEAYLP